MVKKFLGLLSGEIKSVHNAAFVLGAFAILSQLLALIRDRLLAHVFGASSSLDIYYAAFKIPDVIFVTVASLVSVSVLVPFILDYEKGGKDKIVDVKLFIDYIFSFFLGVVIVVSLIVFVLMPYIAPKIFPGFTAIEIEGLIKISRIMLLSPILLGVSNIFGAITQAHNRFFLYAVAPVLYNFGIIFGIIFLVEHYQIFGLAYGVVIGAFLHMLVQVPGVIGQGFFPRIRIRIDFQIIKQVLLLSLPRTFTLATSQIALIVYASLATLMTVGSVAVFNFSYNLQSVPLSIVGVSYSLAAFPTLARLYQGKEMKKFLSHISVALRHIIFWSIPISVYFVVLRAQVIRVILGSGNFSWSDTRLTAASLALFSLSVVMQSAVLLFVRAFYAAGKTRLPLVVNSIAMAVSIGGAYGLYYLFNSSLVFSNFVTGILRIDGIPGAEVVVLALAFSLGSFVNVALLWVMFEKTIGTLFGYVKTTLVHSLGGAVIGGVVAYVGLNTIVNFIETDTVMGIFLQGFIAGAIGITVNLGVLKLLHNSELDEIWATVHRKVWRNREMALVTDDEVV